METVKKYFRVDRHDIGFIKFIIEAYEGLSVMTTVDRSRGVVELNIAPGCEAEIDLILKDLKKELLIEAIDFYPMGHGVMEREPMQTEYLYINTIGCQMNVYDSEKIANVLQPLGYELTQNVDAADLVIVNTCAIRAKAEQKAFSFLGRMAKLKKKRPNVIIGMGGCVAQQEGRKILERMPFVDLVFGTHVIHRLPEMVARIKQKRCHLVDVKMYPGIDETNGTSDAAGKADVCRFVTIMQGCDNFCTYCVVPYVRGRETSRRPESIVSEIQTLIDQGVREVTLLGQNVNSYGRKEGLCSFAGLLGKVNAIKGLERLRFTTSHPKDLSEDLMFAFRDLDKLCRHIHLPVQSGANTVLKRMNRKYTREVYQEKIERLRQICPDIAITSDFIAGFPGETETEFLETLDLIKTVEYDSLFAFVYSDRPNAPAAHFGNKISDAEKKARLQALLDLQEQLTIKKNRSLVGSIQTVLVEGLSRKQPDHMAPETESMIQWSGRTEGNKIVNFNWTDDREKNVQEIDTGHLVHVAIKRALSHSLYGEWVRPRAATPDLKGDKSYAA